jgi:hypothetical protein
MNQLLPLDIFLVRRFAADRLVTIINGLYSLFVESSCMSLIVAQVTVY